MKQRGWTITQGLWVRGEPIGDIDALATGPSGRRYAIDAKGAANCTVEFDQQQWELVLRTMPGARRSTCSRSRAGRRKSFRPAASETCDPCCAIPARVACPPVVDGVAVLPLHVLVAWLEAVDAQPSYSTGLERS